jgi:hypothetical protein
MSDAPIEMPDARPPLGPGDDDPKSPAVDGALAPAPLGPGDDDPRSPVVIVPSAPVVEEKNPDEDFHFLAPPALGPGDAQIGPRHVVRIPKRPPTAAVEE